MRKKRRTFAAKNRKEMKRLVSFMAFVSMVLTMDAQVNAADSVMQHARSNRLSVGGYGEVAYSRHFFSDHVSRYSQPEEHKNDPSHRRVAGLYRQEGQQVQFPHFLCQREAGCY